MAASPPVPQRIPPLSWRSPAVLWTPLALAAGVGWPALAIGSNPAALRLALLFGASVFATGLLALSANWAAGRPPRSRANVVAHLVWAGAAVSLLAPFFVADLFSVATQGAAHPPAKQFSLSDSLALAPLSLLLGLPGSLLSAVIFSWIAFAPPRAKAGNAIIIDRADVQPFD